MVSDSKRVFPKNSGVYPQIIHVFIGFGTMKFSQNPFWGPTKSPYFWFQPPKWNHLPTFFADLFQAKKKSSLRSLGRSPWTWSNWRLGVGWGIPAWRMGPQDRRKWLGSPQFRSHENIGYLEGERYHNPTSLGDILTNHGY